MWNDLLTVVYGNSIRECQLWYDVTDDNAVLLLYDSNAVSILFLISIDTGLQTADHHRNTGLKTSISYYSYDTSQIHSMILLYFW